MAETKPLKLGKCSCGATIVEDGRIVVPKKDSHNTASTIICSCGSVLKAEHTDGKTVIKLTALSCPPVR